MEINDIRKMLTVLGIVLIVAAVYLNLLGILEANTTNERGAVLSYIVSAQIINALAVYCLVILTINATKLNNYYKTAIVLFFLIGILTEIYLVSTNLYSKNYSNYLILIVNLLFRTYYLFYYFNETWAMFPGYYFTGVKELEKVIVPPELTETSKKDEPIIKPKDEQEEFKDKFKDMIRQAVELAGGKENLDNVSKDKAWNQVITPAIKEKDFSTKVLKEAATYLKTKDGKSLDVKFGGRRR